MLVFPKVSVKNLGEILDSSIQRADAVLDAWLTRNISDMQIHDSRPDIPKKISTLSDQPRPSWLSTLTMWNITEPRLWPWLDFLLSLCVEAHRITHTHTTDCTTHAATNTMQHLATITKQGKHCCRCTDSASVIISSVNDIHRMHYTIMKM